MVDQDELEKKLWLLRDIREGKEDYDHNHNVIYANGTKIMRHACPQDEHMGCFIDDEILFKLGVDPRTLIQVDLGNVYNHILGILMSAAYGKITPPTASSRIISYLGKVSREFKELEELG